MVDELHEECGVAAVYLKKPLKDFPQGGSSYYLIKMLLQLQHRGQLSAGISTYNPDRAMLIETYKKMGTVNEAFYSKIKPKSRGILGKYDGVAGIGHVRYATFGTDSLDLAHPLERQHGRKWKWFSFAMNGNIANYFDLKRELEKKDYHLPLNSDTELIMHFLTKELVGSKRRNYETVFHNISKRFDGSYNIVLVDAEGTLVALRDPNGFRPLCYAEDEDKILIASESAAITNLTSAKYKDVRPGEMLLIKNGKLKVKRFAKPKKVSHCMFEWIYFANPSSVMDESSVYKSRYFLGRELAKRETITNFDKDTIVVAVPDTAKPIASAYSYYTRIPEVEGLLRNRYVGRTFIESQSRDERVKEKFSVIRPVLKGKKVILVEDSVVRGTTSKALIKYLREKGGVKEVHLRVGCPPIRFPCFYGIDMSTQKELIAPKCSSRNQRTKITSRVVPPEIVERIRKTIGADTLIYQTLEGLVNAIHLKSGDKKLCMACLTGKYPTHAGRKLKNISIKSFGCKTGRTYERKQIKKLSCIF
jgi:amidophosphoribosyltransferase